MRYHHRLTLFLLAPAFAATFALAQSSHPRNDLAGLDTKAIDKSVNPCDNFYQYSCGNWMKNNPIPPDQAVWGRFSELHERNQQILRQILEKAAVDSPNRNPIEQKIGDYYESCMAEEQIDAKGIGPIEPNLKRIAAMADKKALQTELVGLHRTGVGVFFDFSSEQDEKNSSEHIGGLDQGGLGLPDRDYYLKDDAKSVQLRKQYVEHVQKMFELAGDTPERAAEEAKAVMNVETELAKGSLDRVSLRDPQKIYHRMSVKELTSLSPFLNWTEYFEGMGAPSIESLNVAEPNFFRAVEETVVETNLNDLKSYLRWHVIHAASPLLPKRFVDENFAFYGKVLTGAKELRPRWKRCVQYTDDDLGEALGQEYVKEEFPPDAKAHTLAMVNAIEKAMREDLKTLPWMTEATKKQALVKLEGVKNKIGYPDKWRDYSSLKIVRGDAMGNSWRANEFEKHRQLAKIGQPVDPAEWQMTPPTVNAYYDPQMNNINFPAGILQPPFYTKGVDDALNYGAIGAVVGHELTHGFDDEGRQFDAKGNLRDWWTPEDAKEFDKRADCFVKEYASFEPVKDVHLNGKLTLGENSADNGGLRLAFMALMDDLNGKVPRKIDGYTAQQRFFLGFGQVWCQNERPQIAALRANTDPHSPGEYRVNGVVSNMPEFQNAWACKAGQSMVREPQCRVW